MPFINTGVNSFVNADELFAIIRNKGETSRKIKKVSDKEHKYYCISGKYPVRSLLIFHNGVVMGSAVSAKTLAKRGTEGLAVGIYEDNKNRFKGNILGEQADNDEFFLDDSFGEDDGDDEVDDDEEPSE